jgi:hypothetical protein
MMRLILLTFLIVFCSTLFGQRIGEPSPPKPSKRHQAKIEERNHNCLHRNKYSLAQRMAFYPFDKATTIQIVSFDVKQDSNQLDEITGNTIPVKNDTVCYSLLDEVKSLTKRQIDTLTDILFNVGFRGSVYSMSVGQCFIPRNAILFVDSLNKTFEYVEICFECSRYKVSSKETDMGEFCDQKYDLLKNFFISIGIEIGTLKGNDFRND